MIYLCIDLCYLFDTSLSLIHFIHSCSRSFVFMGDQARPPQEKSHNMATSVVFFFGDAGTEWVMGDQARPPALEYHNNGEERRRFLLAMEELNA